MHYQPTSTELSDIPGMSDSQRIYYFLTRAIESEEIWGHADAQGWIMRNEDDKTILSVWPYKTLAHDCLPDETLSTQAISLEHFIDTLAQALTQQSIHLEILSLPHQAGAIIEAAELLNMFKSLMESGTYFIEG